MAQFKHRKFNEDRFLDKFKGHEAALAAFLDLWSDEIAGLPIPFEIDGFKDFVKTPQDDSAAFAEMLERLRDAYDLCTPKGEEFLHEAIKRNQVSLPGLHELHREVLTLRLYVEARDAFDLAKNLNYAERVETFTTFRGREPRPVSDLSSALPHFKSQLEAFFQERKGSDKVIIRHFLDGDVINFILYHEERRKAEIQIQENGQTLTVQPLIFRPARQDFISYFPSTGKIQIDNPQPAEKAAIRKAFGAVCLGDEEFFEEEGSDTLIDLSPLAAPGFEFTTEEGDSATLRELTFGLPQENDPTFVIRSKDVFATMRAVEMDQRLVNSPATITAAKINIHFAEGPKRGKTITLSSPNRLSFNRSSHSKEIMEYLRQWELTRD